MSERRDEMNGSITTEETYHVSNILKHYAHAKEKHPYFCDKITNFDSSEKVGLRLDECRGEIRYTALNGTVVPRVLLNCEWLEAIEAYLRGNKAQAVEELYDCIAVLLRTIDVLEGRQKLGKHAAKKIKNILFSVLSTEPKI